MLVKPQRFSASFVTRVFYSFEYKNGMRHSINTGRCYDWAYLAYCLWGNVKLWTNNIHAWVQVGSKFYDSEAFQGVRHHSELRTNAAWDWEKIESHEADVQEFKDIWNDIGGGRRFHWHLLRKAISRRGLKPVRK